LLIERAVRYQRVRGCLQMINVRFDLNSNLDVNLLRVRY